MRLDIGLLFFRATVGAMMLFGHGWTKLTGFGAMNGQFPDPIGLGSQVSLSLAVFAEVFCSGLLILGLCARLACVPLVITMLVAAGVVHALDPWAKKEFALLYATCFMTLFFTGPGALSLDAVLPRRRSRL